MGRPSFPRSHPGGPQYREARQPPHYGNRPQDANSDKVRQETWTPKGLFRRLARSKNRQRNQTWNRQKEYPHKLPNHIADTMCNFADTHQTPNAQERLPGAPARRGSDTGPRAIFTDEKVGQDNTHVYRNRKVRIASFAAGSTAKSPQKKTKVTP